MGNAASLNPGPGLVEKQDKIENSQLETLARKLKGSWLILIN